jgi:hypothetical protein
VARWERVVTVLCLAYVVVYGVFFIAVFDTRTMFENPLIFPLHLLGMALSLVMIILVVRDVYKRSFLNPNAKTTWALLIVFGHIFAIPIYLWKYGFRPRTAVGSERDAA